jgi:predicted metal-dependent hydrolase
VPYYTKYHLSEHSAHVLLGPISATLRDLERRAKHYTERLNLPAGADQTLAAAHEALATARREVERLQTESKAQAALAASAAKG